MADNYLEKRMEDYARGRSAAPSRRPGARPGWLSVRCPALTALVVGADCPGGPEVVATFVQAGCRVMFTASDAKNGAALAQKCGGRFYPCGPAGALADMERRSESADVTVVCGRLPGAGEVVAGKSVAVVPEVPAAADGSAPAATVVIAGADMAQAARVCLMVAHPAASMPGQVIRV